MGKGDWSVDKLVGWVDKRSSYRVQYWCAGFSQSSIIGLRQNEVYWTSPPNQTKPNQTTSGQDSGLRSISKFWRIADPRSGS